MPTEDIRLWFEGKYAGIKLTVDDFKSRRLVNIQRCRVCSFTRCEI